MLDLFILSSGLVLCTFALAFATFNLSSIAASLEMRIQEKYGDLAGYIFFGGAIIATLVFVLGSGYLIASTFFGG